jgi:hypothetical protein
VDLLVGIHVVFGSLAIIVIGMTLDPLALRPRFSPGLPLSNKNRIRMVKGRKQKAWGKTQARRTQHSLCVIFGGLAIIVT